MGASLLALNTPLVTRDKKDTLVANIGRAWKGSREDRNEIDILERDNST